MKVLQIHERDNVAVALADVGSGDALPLGGVAAENIPAGHKAALCAMQPGEAVVKYGCVIGRTTRRIPAGAWVHVHNMETTLTSEDDYVYRPVLCRPQISESERFMGYRRADGRAAVRNELWILPLVGCVASLGAQLAQENQDLVQGSIDGLHSFAHSYGCSQMGDDHARTRRLLAALARHPNAGGVLVLTLGCENLTAAQFREELDETTDHPGIRFLVCQDTEDEMAAGRSLLQELAAYAAAFRRESLPASKLVVGFKCGGSDGLSGVTANPAVGALADILTAQGGSAVLTEVPEMFGAESLLLGRCIDDGVFNRAASMLRDFKAYFVSHGQVVYENPSPGNKDGGISTLEEKSCGCVQKGGNAAITDVLAYGEAVRRSGLTLLSGPGNDLVSATALTAAGAHIVLFTTGRGTPFGAPAPTLKIASNTALYAKKNRWMDFDAGTVAAGESVPSAGRRLFDLVLDTASGRKTRSEQNGCREMAIWKDGVTL